MFSVRVAARSAPRSISRVASAAIRSSAVRPALQAAVKPAAQHIAAFSAATVRLAKEGEVDEELAAKFESELQIENEMKAAEDELPVSVEEFLKNSPWELQDVPGQEEVVLTRTFGDETIKVTFSIDDLNNIDQDGQEYGDRALEDEDDTNINADSEQFKVAPEDQLDEGEEDLDMQEPGFPARVSVVITKKGKGGLRVETVATDGTIAIDNVYYYTDAADADAQSAEIEHKTSRMYAGPPFLNLDVDLQVLFERYLDERGINTSLALFVPDYIDLKEQREYIRWLGNVKNFVEA